MNFDRKIPVFYKTCKLEKERFFPLLLAELFCFENYQVRFSFSRSLEWYIVHDHSIRFSGRFSRNIQKYSFFI
jgi:hypothetical protein